MNFSYLEDFLNNLVSEHQIPGVDCIVKKRHETIFRHHAGFADKEAGKPMTGSELFNLYSATKAITCVAVLQLFEQGKLLLTDPVHLYLPEYRHMLVKHVNAVGTVSIVPAQHPITIKHLLSMSAGMDYDLTSPVFAAVHAQTDGKSPTREVVRQLAGKPLIYEPGTDWLYSLAHDVLGAVVEVVSGERFGDYLQNHIFKPLGMTRTGFSRNQVVLDQMMAQYMRDTETGVISRISLDNEFVFGTEYESGGAGLISCVDDYSRFIAALASGGVNESGTRILSPATIDLMRMNHLNETQAKSFAYPELAGYGYGLGVRTLVDKVAGGSNGPVGEFGWSGAAGIYFLIDPENEISLFFAQHVRETIHSKLHPYIHPRLRNILYSSL